MGYDKIAQMRISPILILLLILSGCGENPAGPESAGPTHAGETLGQVVFSVPMPPGLRPHGLAWDGENFWVASYLGKAGLYRINPDTGEMLDHYRIPDVDEGRNDYSGLAFCPGYLWVAFKYGGPIYKLDLPSLKAVHAILSPFPPNKVGVSYIEDLAWDGEALWVAGSGGMGCEIRRIDPRNGATLSLFKPEEEWTGGAGLAYDGRYLWLGTGNVIRKINPRSLAILEEFPTKVKGIGGLTYVNGYMWCVSDEMLHKISLAPLGRRKIYVDWRNTGFEDGSRAHPYSTIQKGLGAAEYGDDVLVAAGVYRGGFRLRRGIDLIGAGADETIILLPPNEMIRATMIEDATISGFTILCQGKGRKGNWSAILCEGSDIKISKNTITLADAYMSGLGIFLLDSPRAVVSDNIIIGGFFHSILSGRSISDNDCGPTIEGNTISQAYEAIHCSASSPLLRNNVIVQNNEGVHCYGSSPKLEGNRIVDNRIGVRCRGGANPDLGGGARGSRGHNIIHNDKLDVYNETDNTIKAENNWWGKPHPDASRFFGKVDYEPSLQSEPAGIAPLADQGRDIQHVKPPMSLMGRVYADHPPIPTPPWMQIAPYLSSQLRR
jgi:parallel beta-helix repeat protein